FEIALNKGFYWHAAKSVPNKDGGSWIRLNLRGQRPLGEKTSLTFRYLLSGADTMRVRLVDSKSEKMHEVEQKKLTKGKWSELTVDLTDKGVKVADEIHFRVADGAELLVDDVLLYEPGQ